MKSENSEELNRKNGLTGMLPVISAGLFWCWYGNLEKDGLGYGNK